MHRLLLLFATICYCAAGPAATVGIRVPAWISNETPGPRRAIPAKNLVVNVNGRNVSPIYLLSPQSDLFLLIGLDLTGDIGATTEAKEALKKQIEQLPRQAYTALFGCKDSSRVLLDPSDDRAAASRVIDALPITGRSGLLDCLPQVESVADAMMVRSAVRVGVLFITDSVVENYREDFVNPIINSSDPNDLSRLFPEQLIQDFVSKLEARMELQQTPIFIVHLNYQTDRLNQAYQSALKPIVRNTLGNIEFCRTLDAIPVAIGDAIQRLLNQYSMKINVSAAAIKADIHIAPVDGLPYVLTYRSHFSLH